MPGVAQRDAQPRARGLVADEARERISRAHRPSASRTRAAIALRVAGAVDAHEPAVARGEHVVVGGDHAAVELDRLALDAVGRAGIAPRGRLLGA